MQPIERYALVTLLFLVVLVVVGALWDDGEVAASGDPVQEIARAEREEARPSASSRRSRAAGRPPLNIREPAAEVARQRTAAPRRTAAPLPSAQAAPAYTARGAAASTPPAAPTAADLADALQREPGGGAAGSYVNPRGLTPPADRRRVDMDSLIRPNDQPRRGSVAAGPIVAPAPKARTYTIRSGDSLGRIAQRELGDPGAVDRIASLNGLSKPYTIYAGRTLLLPAAGLQPASASSAPTSVARAAAAPAPRATDGRTTYTVRPGDSLSVVLEREFGTSKRSLPLVKTLNPGLDPNQIRVGMRIVLPRADEIPGGVSVASVGSSPAPSAVPATVRAPQSTRREFVVR